MVAAIPRKNPDSLRQKLRVRTQALHDRLDGALGSLAIGDSVHYAAFLTAQYAARGPIDAWCEDNLPLDLRPPHTAHLIAEDLADLGSSVPDFAVFTFPRGGHPLGVCWALGGSSLGNAVLLRQRQRAGHSGAARFLSAAETATYFRRLRPLLDVDLLPDETKAAVAAAEAVFRTFIAAAAAVPAMSAAA